MDLALFVTCLTDSFFPRVGEAVVRVLRHLGCKVHFPRGQTCCGQPAYNSGFHHEAALLIRHMVRVFEPYDCIVTPSASCATMVRHQGPDLFAAGSAERQRALRLASRTWEFSQFLREVRQVDPASMLSFAEPVTFHYPCHARECYSVSDLERWLCGGASVIPVAGVAPGTRVASDASVAPANGRCRMRETRTDCSALATAPSARPTVPALPDLCCGFGGLFSIEYPHVSSAMARDKIAQLAATGARVVVCNEAACALQILGAAHRHGVDLRCKHMAECMAESLGLMEPNPVGPEQPLASGRGSETP